LNFYFLLFTFLSYRGPKNFLIRRHDKVSHKKLSLVLLAAWLLLLSTTAANPWDLFQEYDKVIFINQPNQIGIAYQDGHKLREFPVLTGDDECTTDPGIYVIRHKDPDYYSQTYDTPMPYSMFFDWPHRKAIHEEGVTSKAEKRELARCGPKTRS
jgi:hypothetical protein